jgi:hypothetical protein
MSKQKRQPKSAGAAHIGSKDVLGGFTAEQVMSDPEHLKAFISQPRAVLFLLRELFEQVPESGQQLALIDSGIQTLTFLIGDGMMKAGKR